MKYTKYKLKNDSILGIVHIPESYTATLSAFIPAGFKYDPKDKPGLAHFTEHMLFNGTKRYPSPLQQSWSIERFGGYLSAFTWIDYQQLIIHLPKSNYELGVQLLLEMLTSPILSEKEFEREKGVIKEEILRNRSDPEKALLDYAWQPLFFEGTTLARPYSGTLKDIDNLNLQDARSFFKERFATESTTYLMAGNVDTEKMVKVFDKGMRNYSVGKHSSSLVTVTPKQVNRIRVFPYKTEHVSLALGIETVRFDDEEKYVLELIKDILGGYFGARLPQKFRERGGLIYNWNIWQDNLQDTGYLVFMSSTSSVNVDTFVQIVLEEFNRLTTKLVGKEELKVACGHIVGGLFCNTQTGLDFVNWYGLQEFFVQKSISLSEQTKIYRRISTEDILKTAKKYLSPNKILIAAVGEVKKSNLENLLAKYRG